MYRRTRNATRWAALAPLFSNILERNFTKASEICLPSELPPDAPADQRANTFVDRGIVLVYMRRWDVVQQELDRAIELRPAAGDVLHLAARMAITAHLERYEPAWLAAPSRASQLCCKPRRIVPTFGLLRLF